MKKICFVTAARSEYGLLRWIMSDIRDSGSFQFQLVVTGGHLMKSQGNTINQIFEDGFTIDEVVDVSLDNSNVEAIARSMGRMSQILSEVFAKLKPDYIAVLGDRYELLSICNVAFVMRIPIIHFSGGDRTEGAIDDGIRNAVTMLSDYHFPGTKESADNVARMRGSKKNIWNVGEPGLDSFFREKMMSRCELAKNLGIDENKKWILMTYHSETKESLEYNLSVVENCLEVLLDKENYQVVATYANADFGGMHINDSLEKYASNYKNQIVVIPSLGHSRYLSFMRQVYFVIGNSSSGIVEAPFLGIPVINIGNRQSGRYFCSNIIQCGTTKLEVSNAIDSINDLKLNDSNLYYWGDGHTSERVLEILKKELR